MKRSKLIVYVLVLSLLICCVSCNQAKSNLCYYGYFSDKAVMIAYNGKQNVVYDIVLPYDAIVAWGIETGTENIPNAIRFYAGAKDSGFLMGNTDTFEGLKMINKAVLSDRSVLENNSVLNNINKLCMTDVTSLIASINSDTKFEKINAEEFAGSREHFASWVKQIYGE